jgi:NodT family efflux transporter outer membrane factor (OMF) lipoprotein
MSNPNWKRRGVLVAGVLATSLAGCAATVGDVAPPAELPPQFSASGAEAAPARWWQALGDPRLDALMDQAMAGNFGLRAAWDRLRQAQAVADESRALLLPGVDGSAGASRAANHSPRFGTTYATSFSLGLAATYELDLWGRLRSTYDAARLDAAAGEADLRAAAMTLSAQVASTWFWVVESRGQLGLLDGQVRTNKDYLEMVTVKFGQGQVSATDVLQQRQVLEQTRGERHVVASRLAVLKHALAALLGRAAGQHAPPPEGKLPALPALPATGVPAECVQARPDVRAAWLRVRAADQRTAAAIAEQFPRVGLSARADTTAERVRDLFDNWLASLAANLAAPLFDAGQRRAEIERSRAAAAERLHAYAQAVLTAVAEVEDALAEEAHQRRYVESLRKQLTLSEQSVQQVRDSYAMGAMDFTRLLTTLLSHQRLQRTHLQARRELIERRIDLYRALGRGWEPTPPPNPPRRVVGPVERVVSSITGTKTSGSPRRDPRERPSP